MKKYIFIIISLVFTGLSFAQGPEFDKEAMRQRMEQLKAEKVAFFTEKMNLDAETAQKFWPVYNAYEAEKMKTHEEFRNLMRKYWKGKKNDVPMTDEAYLEMADAMVNAKVKQAELMKSYHSKFKAILSPEQLVKYYRADEQFGREMIKKFHSERGNRGDNDPPR